MNIKTSPLDTQNQRVFYQTELFEQFIEELRVGDARALLAKLIVHFKTTVQKVRDLKLDGWDKSITDNRIDVLSDCLKRLVSLLGGNDSVCDKDEDGLFRLPIIFNLAFVAAELRSLTFTLNATTFAFADQVKV